MPAALLAVLLIASTVDPRLAEPLRLLAEAHDAGGQPIGARYASLVTALHLTLELAELESEQAGRYHAPTHTVTIAEAALAEDPRFIAAALAHKLRHASDADLIAVGLLEPDSLERETRGFEAQAVVARKLWPDELPSGTRRERELAALVRLYEREGPDGIRAHLARDAAYLEVCAGLTAGSTESV
jgi:hypothetical protein